MSILNKSIKKCSDLYGFKFEDAMFMLNSDNESYPLPFNKNYISTETCQGLSYNSGLYTQCTKECIVESTYCKNCLKESQNDSSGIPICGNITSRLNADLMLHTDRKGRKPCHYLEVLQKSYLPLESALAYAKSLSIIIRKLHIFTRFNSFIPNDKIANKAFSTSYLRI